MREVKEYMPGRDRHSFGRNPNYDPDVTHVYNETGGWAIIYPAGVNPEFDGVEYEDESIPPEER